MLSLLECHEDHRDHPPHYRKEPAATSSRMNEHCVALLGRRDEPTDAVEDYCRYLGAALQPLGFSMAIERLSWSELGWRRARRELNRRAEQWRDGWVFLQYTALAWSRRGFPLAVLRILRELRTSGARTAVVFHDAEPYGGNRAVDYLRRMVQLRAMRKALRLADFAVTTLPAQKISWLPADCPKTVFIPVGANLPSPEDAWRKSANSRNELPTVAVFTVTGDANVDRAGQEEVDCIAKAVRCAAERVGAIRVALLGRNSERAEKRLRANLYGAKQRDRGDCLRSAGHRARGLGDGTSHHGGRCSAAATGGLGGIRAGAGARLERCGVSRVVGGAQPPSAGKAFLLERDCRQVRRGNAREQQPTLISGAACRFRGSFRCATLSLLNQCRSNFFKLTLFSAEKKRQGGMNSGYLAE